MQSSLGIYIEENIIKYAKLQKDKDVVKIEAYNVAFYDNDLAGALKKIISETYSYKVPVSINVSDELYNTFQISTLIGKKDIKKVVNMEYELLCNEKGYNKTSLDHKFLLTSERDNTERRNVISVIANKNEISKRITALDGNKVNTITPITTSIVNLVDIDAKENIAIVNIEEKTKITTIIDGEICQIDELEDGMGKILHEINKVENSLSKSYDVCKNMTIYTRNAAELYAENSEYMEMVTTVLYKIVNDTKNILNNMFTNIDKIYITGLGTCINNIDLFFQDYITNSKCEILKPYFVDTSAMQISIKDYIEVNSAVALALDGLGFGDKTVNFSKNAKSTGGSSKSVKDALNSDVDLDTIKNIFANLGDNIKRDFSEPLQSAEKVLVRGIVACLLTAGVFTVFSNSITNQIDIKTKEVAKATKQANAELEKIDSDITTIESRTKVYEDLIEEITAPADLTSSDEITSGERIILKDSIPNLLNRIMFVIPKKVKLTSIKNTTSNHIEIKAEAEKYEQLGYFKAVLSTNGILKNVKSTSGQKNGSVVEVTIEGDLP